MKKYNFIVTKPAGMTLIELLVVISILGLLTVVVLPALSGNRENNANRNASQQVSGLISQSRNDAISAGRWAGFTVLIPIIDSDSEITFQVYLLLLQRFLLVVVLILPFDIRDVKYDSISLQTIPRKIGFEKTKRLGLVLMIFCLILEYLASTTNTMQTPFMLFFFLVILLLMRAKKDQSQYYSSFGVESLPIVWWLIHLGFHNF